MSAIKGLYYCGNCRSNFYTDDGLKRHMCPGTDFETHPIGTRRRLARLEREISHLRQSLKSIKIIASDYVGEPHDRRESDSGTGQGPE